MADVTRIAVIGYGLVGRRHAEAIRADGRLSLAGIVEPDPAGRADAMALGAPVLDDLAGLAGVAPDGCVIATPTPLHLPLALDCIARGWPLLIEKPIAVTTAEARRIVDAAAAAGVPVLVGHHRRHNGRVAAAKSALAGGAIGDIRAVQCTCWFYKPDAYFEAAPWRKRPGAGPISVNLVHDVDLLRHFCGEVAAVRAVTAPSARGYDNEDLAAAILTFASGAIGTLSVSDSVVAPWSWELTSGENPVYPQTEESCYLIGGARGALSIPDMRLWQHAGDGGWWTPMETAPVPCEDGDALAAQMAHFAQVIRGEVRPLVSAEEGTRSLAIVEAVDRSARTGEVVMLGADGLPEA